MANIVGENVKSVFTSGTLSDMAYKLNGYANQLGMYGWFTSEPWANIDLAVSGLGPAVASTQLDSIEFTHTYHGLASVVSNGIDIILTAADESVNRSFTESPTALILSDTVSSSYHPIDGNTILAIPIGALTFTGPATAGSYFIADPITIQLR
jgi:hypothetical protein